MTVRVKTVLRLSYDLLWIGALRQFLTQEFTLQLGRVKGQCMKAVLATVN